MKFFICKIEWRKSDNEKGDVFCGCNDFMFWLDSL